MALTESQVASLEAILEEVEASILRCGDRLLTLEEAKGKLTDLWEKSRAIVHSDSDEWRLLDRAKKEGSGWWRVESSGYVASGDAAHFVKLRNTLNQIIERGSPEFLRSRTRARAIEITRGPMGYVIDTLRSMADSLNVPVQDLREALKRQGYDDLPKSDDAAVRIDAAALQEAKEVILARAQIGFERYGDKPAPRPAHQPTHVEDYQFDVAISFADPERGLAKELAEIVRAAGYTVFYDRFYQEDLWGQDLAQLFQKIFGERSRFCVIFVSLEYLKRTWTIHELRTAVGRSIQMRGGEYILPVQVGDPLQLPGVPPQVGYVSIRDYPLNQLANLLIKKLKKSAQARRREASPPARIAASAEPVGIKAPPLKSTPAPRRPSRKRRRRKRGA